MKRMNVSERIRKLEERVEELESMVSLAKARCRNCDRILTILPTTAYVNCKCGKLFGDAKEILASIGLKSLEVDGLEWIHTNGYENQLLMSHLRREAVREFPRVLPRKPSEP